MNEMKRCANPCCRRFFLPNPRVKNQRYCGRKDCRRLRRRLWQREKRRSDPDYRANQLDCQKRWRKQNPEYWQQYRMGNPQYVERNRLLQRRRDEKRRLENLAKMDSLSQVSLLKSGTYYVVPDDASLAKMDSLWRKYLLIPAT
jgi:hypothetical protein